MQETHVRRPKLACPPGLKKLADYTGRPFLPHCTQEARDVPPASRRLVKRGEILYAALGYPLHGGTIQPLRAGSVRRILFYA